MQCEIEKASLWKRFAAALLDLILVVIIVTGMFATLAGIFQFDSHLDKMEEVYNRYTAEYQLDPDMTEEKWEAMPEAERNAYNERQDAANKALQTNQADMQIYVDVMVALLLIITVAVLVAMLLLEFVVPLLFGNGQTVGKKIFSLCVVRQDSVRIKPLQLFVRTIIGRFAIETMIPVCVAIMYFMGFMNLFTLLLLAALVIAEIAILIVTKNNCMLHDLMAGTAVADYSCQRIFYCTEDMVEYQKKLEAERENRKNY